MKIAEIKEHLKNTKDEALQEFINAYADDERSAVRELVTKAEKKQAAWQAELKRTEAMKRFEKEYADCEFICGVDEVGRGPLAGPIVAGAVILPKDCSILYLNDSKQLTEKKREELNEIIQREAVSYGIGCVGPERIDEINILQADYEAMREAVSKLTVKPDLLLNDAVTIPDVNIKQVPIIKGDAQSISIAAASIIAKVHRDHMMVSYDELFPLYGFASNKGYGSSAHIAAIREFGPCVIHRRSFIGNFI